jgi:hypothetical protein
VDEPSAPLPSEALQYYARGEEAARLEQGHGLLEFARTCEILEHRNPTSHDYFTTTFFHHPDELRAEVAEAGFSVEAVLGVEGPGWALPDLAARWADPARRHDILAAARAVESEPSLLGLNAHLLAVGRVPPAGG